jgi:Coenzyme PQQ synthesis protein D (PqqD)
MPVGPQSIIIQDQEPIVASVHDEVVMLSARAEAYFGLDGVGSEIWNMIEQPRRVRDICAQLVGRYEVEPQTCEDDLLKFLYELLDYGLIRLVDQEAAR